jgi:hypothetical protein
MKPGVVEDYSRSVCFVAKAQNGKDVSDKLGCNDKNNPSINKHSSPKGK